MHVRLMRRQDIARVVSLDREVFPTDWPPTNFAKELDNRLASYIVATENPPPPIPVTLPPQPKTLSVRLKSLFSKSVEPPVIAEDPVLGYAGVWILADEAHIMSIASGPEVRRRGVGEALLLAIFDLARQHKARVVTLEVRVSNKVAQNLYTKFGFNIMGTRKGYYLDNREDATIMTTDYLESVEVQNRLQILKNEFALKYGQLTFDLDKPNQPGK